MFPVLPDLVFLSYHPKTVSDMIYLCEREEIVPAHEYSLQLADYDHEWGWSDQMQREIAIRSTYVKCLGVYPGDITYGGTVPEDFIRATQCLRVGSVGRGSIPWASVNKWSYRSCL